MNMIGVGVVLAVFAVALFFFGFLASFIGFSAGIIYLIAILLALIAAYFIKTGIDSAKIQSEDVDHSVQNHPLPKKNDFVFFASGIDDYCSDRIYDDFLCDNNPEYSLSKPEMISECLINDKVYLLEPSFGPCEILPDPNNKRDPNSLKVLKGKTQIGFVPDEYVNTVKQLLSDHPNAETRCWITGGDYKLIKEDFSIEHDRQIYTLETGTAPLQVKVTISYS